MAEAKTEKVAVQTGGEAGVETPKKKTSKKTEAATGKTPKKKTAKKGPTFAENKITDSETARERGRNGGIKSGATRRAQRDARDTIQYMLGRMAKSESFRNNLKELGFEETEFTNMAALHGRLFTMAMQGNLEAYMTLMRMGGYEPEEVRKERESLASDRRKNLEIDAKIEAIGARGENASVALNMNDEEGNTDVVIYMPQIMDPEDCEVSDTPADEESESPANTE